MSADFVKSISEFRRDRYGVPWASRSLLFWYPSKGVRLIAATGRVTLSDIDFLVAAMGDEVQPGFTPFASLVDMSDVEHIDATGFERYVAFIRSNIDGFCRVNLRSAYVHGSGNRLASAAVAGYTSMLGDPFPTTTHETVEEGLVALGFADSAQDVSHRLAVLKRVVRETYRLLGPLDTAILCDLIQPSPARIAEELGLTPRTLQRELSKLETTLTQEVRRVRIAHARELLRASRSIADVAAEVGFGTTKAFRAAFKKVTGKLPSEWRDGGHGGS